MYQVITCPIHGETLVFWKNTPTHSLFRCPQTSCNYVDYPGVVHRDLPERYNKLQAENKRLNEFITTWNGHYDGCGATLEGFEGCDETMFNCSCGYEKARQQALKGKDNDNISD